MCIGTKHGCSSCSLAEAAAVSGIEVMPKFIGNMIYDLFK